MTKVQATANYGSRRYNHEVFEIHFLTTKTIAISFHYAETLLYLPFKRSLWKKSSTTLKLPLH